LQYSWFFYPEAGSGLPNSGSGRPGGGPGGTGPATPVAPGPGLVSGIPSAPPGGRRAPPPRVTVANATTSVATIMPNAPGTAHLILAVTDSGTPSLTSYRRVILAIRNRPQ
jgi:hypothetical protein